MNDPKTTLVLGASDNPSRYSFLAIQRLRAQGYPVKAVGLKHSVVEDVVIETQTLPFEGVDTVTLYLSPQHQPQYYDYILSLSPRRIIFNPGAENPELKALADQKGIETLEACTLVMLSTAQY